MKQPIRWIIVPIAGLIGIGVLSAGFLLGWFDTKLPAGKETAAANSAGDGVRVETVQPIPRSTVQPAHVEPLEQVEVVPKIAGYLQSFGKDLDGKEIDTGSRVRPGQVLAVLSVPEMHKELEAKKASLKYAEAEVEKYEFERDFRESELKRQERFFKQSLVQEDVLDEKRKQYRAAQAAVKSAHERVHVARRESEAFAELLKYATVRLQSNNEDHPRRSGDNNPQQKDREAVYIVTRRWSDPNNYLQPGGGSQRAALLSLARIDRVKIVADVPELDSSRVEVGDQAVFQPTALPGQKFEGKVSRFSSALDPQTRTMRVEIDLPNPSDRPLYPNMYGTLTVFLSERKGILTVPSSCVRKEGQNTYVYCMVGGRAKNVPVTIGMDDGSQVEILKGLQAASRVIRIAHGSLAEGQAVAELRRE